MITMIMKTLSNELTAIGLEPSETVLSRGTVTALSDGPVGRSADGTESLRPEAAESRASALQVRVSRDDPTVGQRGPGPGPVA